MSVHTCALLLVFVLVLLTASTSAIPSGGHQNEVLARPAQVQCSAADARCWSEGQLPHANGSCYAALSRGPCREGQWWRLRDRAGRSVRGRCARLSCAPDTRSRACRLHMQQVAEACPHRPDGQPEFATHMDPAGDYQCGAFPGRVEALHALVQCVGREGVARGTGAVEGL